MSALIYRDETIEQLTQLRIDYLDGKCGEDAVHDALMYAYAKVVTNCMDIVRTVPIHESVVRCKDCENAIDIGRDYLLCPMIDCRVKANFFCAYGEKCRDEVISNE